jgi:hypothetical protein
MFNRKSYLFFGQSVDGNMFCSSCSSTSSPLPVLGHRGLRWVGRHLIGIEFFIDLLLLVDDQDNERSGAAGR